MKSNKEILKESVPGLTTSFIILLIIILFKPSYLVLMAGLSLWVFGKGLYYKKPAHKTTGELLALLFIVTSIKIFYDVFGSAGLWSLLAVVFFLAGIILYRAREQYLEVLRSIEKSYFGMTAEERKELRKNGRKRT